MFISIIQQEMPIEFSGAESLYVTSEFLSEFKAVCRMHSGDFCNAAVGISAVDKEIETDLKTLL